ncbi:beta-galactosidase [Brevundimonas sp.]|uniref:beta-galactosidase n=1 Tax=Brevundimonas sp. TaxID=1871086 RepID=UPI002899CE86|nr:beta-galactosidase [Brevundimonas sp.]
MNRRQLLAASALAALPSGWARAQTAAGIASSLPAPVVGTSWYPEQWAPARWPADLDLMRQAGLKVVRMGEFAWSRMEPEDGRFDFGWLDEAIALAAAHGMRTVLGTPTAAPPIWLTEAHPAVRRMEEDGRVQGHGERRQFSVASPTYRRYAVRIATEMARRYGRDANVVGWQIDNELGLETFDPETKAQWARWLERRYGTVAGLNARWTTAYWSQTYQRFDQVPLSLGRDQNPALVLDTRRFFSRLWADYVADQARALRAFARPGQFVTTNSTLWNNHFDQHLVHEAVDLAAWDVYAPSGRPDWAATALHHAVVRGYRQRTFWVMETQPGFVNWGALNRSLDPGETRLMAWQAVARGADAVLYWQWRSALGGQEQMHGVLVGPDGRPTAVFPEVAQTAREFALAADAITGSAPRAQVALIYDQDSRWALEQQRHAKDYDPVAVMRDWHRPFFERNIDVDVVFPGQDLSGYRLVLAPALNVVDAGMAGWLEAYVRGGGWLVMGPRGGLKDDDNALWPARQPGPLAPLFGAEVDGFYALDDERPLAGTWPATARVWAETIRPVDPAVEVWARYATGGWTQGRPAVVARPVGEGGAVYVGALLDAAGQGGLIEALLARRAVASPQIQAPKGVEVATRDGPHGLCCFLLNHSDQPASISILLGARVMLGDMTSGSLPVGGFALLLLGHPEIPVPS